MMMLNGSIKSSSVSLSSSDCKLSSDSLGNDGNLKKSNSIVRTNDYPRYQIQPQSFL